MQLWFVMRTIIVTISNLQIILCNLDNACDSACEAESSGEFRMLRNWGSGPSCNAELKISLS